MNRQTLLAHFALRKKFSDKYENIAVEALGHILSTSPAAVRALENVANRRRGDWKIAWVETQASGEEGTRPDLVGFDQHNKERVLIEAKFWAGLTDNQPVAYLKRLPENQASALLFVAPAARLNTLWAELRRKVSESESGIALGTDRSETEGLWSTTAGGKRRLMLISWTALLDRMASRASTARESHTECDIQQLRGLAEQMDKEAFLPLRPEEFSPEFPRRLISLVKLVKDVIKCLQKERLVDRIWNPTDTQMSYGRYLLLSRSDAGAWFGIDHYKWNEERDTPLWLFLYDRSNDWPDVKPLSEILDNLRRPGLQDPPEFIDKGGHLVIPIYLPVGVAEDAVLDAVVERIKEIGNLINPAD